MIFAGDCDPSDCCYFAVDLMFVIGYDFLLVYPLASLEREFNFITVDFRQSELKNQVNKTRTREKSREKLDINIRSTDGKGISLLNITLISSGFTPPETVFFHHHHRGCK